MNKQKKAMFVLTETSVASQVDLDNSAVKKLISRLFKGVVLREIRYLSHAFTNKTMLLRLEGAEINKVVIKICVNADRFPRLKLEADLIKRISKETDIPVPKIIYKDFSMKWFKFPFIIYSFLPGENLADAIVHIKNKDKLGSELSKIARQIHSINLEGPQFSLAEKKPGKSWKKIIEVTYKDGVAMLKNYNYSRALEVKKYIHQNIAMVPEPEKYTLVHRDLQPQNLHWGNESQKIVGVFDFESSMSGDFHFEFNFLERRLFKTYPVVRKSFYASYSKYRELNENYIQLVHFYEVVRDLYFYKRNLHYGELDRANKAVESIERLIFKDWLVG